MNIPVAFQQMKDTVAHSVIALLRVGSGATGAVGLMQRELSSGLCLIQDVAYSVDAGARSGGHGPFRVIGEWRQGQSFQHPIVGQLREPIGAVLQNERGEMIAFVVAEPSTCRMWTRLYDGVVQCETIDLGDEDCATCFS